MKRYLVPFEGSDLSKSAVMYALQLSKGVSGIVDIRYIADERVTANPLFDLTILALQGIGTLGDYLPREKARMEMEAKLLARGEELLDELKESTGFKEQSTDIQYTAESIAGNPPNLLIDLSPEYHIVFMGLWGEMYKYKAGLWGGTSEAVIRKGACPVFLATSEFKPFESILVGFDGRPRSRQALAWAGVMGENMGLPVVALVCSGDNSWADETIAAGKAIAESYDTRFKFQHSDENAAVAILDVSESGPNFLICMGAFGDQPLRELFLGSVADEVLRRSKSPVFLLK